MKRTAAAMRTALVDRKMTRFDAPRLVGVVPQAGRTVERVEARGRSLWIEWDDHVILCTRLRLSGSWHLYRPDESWDHTHRQLAVLIEVPGWVAVCFNVPRVETFRAPDPLRHPGLGGLGPDVGSAHADLGRAARQILEYRDPDAPVGDVLLDERVLCGLGNVYRSEVLWACALDPFARVGDLIEEDATRLVDVAATLVRLNLQRTDPVAVPAVADGPAVYARNGQRCHRCGASIASRRTGERGQVLYWCPGCQVRHDRAASAGDDTRPMDPHPAAVAFLADLSQRAAG